MKTVISIRWISKVVIITILLIGSNDIIQAKSNVSSVSSFTVDGLKYQVRSTAQSEVGVAECIGKQSEIFIPEKVEYEGNTYTVTGIFEYAFENCSNIEKVELPETLRFIAARAFWGCKSLKDINLPESLTSIGVCSFWGCESLTSIFLPENIVNISKDIFRGCINLTNLSISENHKSYCSFDDVVFDKSKTNVIFCAPGKTEVTLPEGVLNIEYDAFYDCKNLEYIRLPSSLNQIAHYAFHNCEKLNNVEIPDKITSLGTGCFLGCRSLDSIKLPPSLEKIEDLCFCHCGFKSLEIPSSIRTLGRSAFQGCEELNTVYISKGLESIDGTTFWSCYNLVNFIVDEENLYFSSAGPLLLNKDGDTLLSYPAAVGDIVIPEGITKVEHNVLSSNATTSITFPSTMRDIGLMTFEGNMNIQWFKCLSVIPPEAPYYMVNVEAMSEIVYVPTYVPAESLALYKAAPYWGFCKIVPIDYSDVNYSFTQDCNEHYEVYILDGTHIVSTYDKSLIQTLPPGLYIVNGQKKIIK